MPNRIFSDKAWSSDRLRNVNPDCFRSEYAWIYSLALVDGTFECDPQKVWSQCYAPSRQISGEDGWTVARVSDLLDEFERVGLLFRAVDNEGKRWGCWYNCDESLPQRSHWFKYKRGKRYLFTTETVSRPSHDEVTPYSPLCLGVGLGLGFGLGKQTTTPVVSMTGLLDDCDNQNTSAQDHNGRIKGQIGYYKKNQYPGTNPKKIHKYIQQVWDRIKGEAAIAAYPSLFPESWERLCDTKSADLIIPAFELWCEAEGKFTKTRCPVADFIKRCEFYMSQIIPMKDAVPKITAQQILDTTELVKKQRAEIWASPIEEVTASDPGPDDFFKEDE